MKSKVRDDLAALQIAITTYYVQNYKYPDPINWEQDIKHFLPGERTPIDPWGNHYVYVYPGKYNPEGYDLYSMGRDGLSKSGGMDPDDICTCKKGSSNGQGYIGPDYPPDPPNAIIVGIIVILLVCTTYLILWNILLRIKLKSTAVKMLFRIIAIIAVVIIVLIIIAVLFIIYPIESSIYWTSIRGVFQSSA